MADPQSGNGQFLPLDFYYIESEYGGDLIQKYSDNNGISIGYSKWFDTQGGFTWEECRVIGYSNEEDKYEIIWNKNKKTKLVTRVNLMFKLEDREQFEEHLKTAEFHRKRSEIFMYIINLNYKVNITI